MGVQHRSASAVGDLIAELSRQYRELEVADQEDRAAQYRMFQGFADAEDCTTDLERFPYADRRMLQAELDAIVDADGDDELEGAWLRPSRLREKLSEYLKAWRKKDDVESHPLIKAAIDDVESRGWKPKYVAYIRELATLHRGMLRQLDQQALSWQLAGPHETRSNVRFTTLAQAVRWQECKNCLLPMVKELNQEQQEIEDDPFWVESGIKMPCNNDDWIGLGLVNGVPVQRHLSRMQILNAVKIKWRAANPTKFDLIHRMKQSGAKSEEIRKALTETLGIDLSRTGVTEYYYKEKKRRGMR